MPTHTHILTFDMHRKKTQLALLSCVVKIMRCANASNEKEKKGANSISFWLVVLLFYNFVVYIISGHGKKPLKMKMANTLPIPIQSLLATDMAIKSQNTFSMDF